MLYSALVSSSFTMAIKPAPLTSPPSTSKPLSACHCKERISNAVPRHHTANVISSVSSDARLPPHASFPLKRYFLARQKYHAIFLFPAGITSLSRTRTHTRYSSNFLLNGLLPESDPLLLIELELFSTRLRDKNTTLVSSQPITRLHLTHVSSNTVPQRRIPVCAVANNVLCAVTRPVSHRFDRFSVVTPGPRSWDDIANTLRLPPLSEEGNPLASRLGHPHSYQSL